MKKKIFPLLIILVLMIAIFAGCESYKAKPIPGGDANAIVTDNGGLSVKQGDYIYFINGQAGYDAKDPKTNYFGKVLKGSIMRGKLEGNVLKETKVIVPKNVMASSDNVGFSIYGEWIYYVSPSTGTDNTGKVLTEYIDFFKTKIDGTGTKFIKKVKGNDTKFKFTKNSLFYFINKDKKLMHIDLNTNKETAIEEVTSVFFPESKTYNPKAKNPVNDYVLYTLKAENDLDRYNRLMATNGTDTKTLINNKSFTNDDTDLNNIYSVSILDAVIENDKLTVFYNKSTISSNENSDKGLHAYSFDKSFSFDKNNERRFTLTKASNIYPLGFDKGVLVLENDIYDFLKYDAESKVIDKVEFKFPKGATIIGDNVMNDKSYVYYVASDKLYRMPLDVSENAANYGEFKYFKTFAGPDIIGNNIYYIATEDYNYTHMLDLTSYDINDAKAVKDTFIGKMTTKDKEAKDKAEAEKK